MALPGKGKLIPSEEFPQSSSFLGALEMERYSANIIAPAKADRSEGFYIMLGILDRAVHNYPGKLG